MVQRTRTLTPALAALALLAGLMAAGNTDTNCLPVPVEPSEPVCPAEWPQPGQACSGDQTCSYGEECCCGECYPSYECTCVDGQYACLNTDACMMPECPGECPAEWPQPGQACSGDQTCSYGEECCCGACYPSFECTCAGGQFACYYTDACLVPGC